MSDADIECELKDLVEQPLVKRSKKTKTRSIKRKSHFKLKRKNLSFILSGMVLVLLVFAVCLFILRPSRSASIAPYRPRKAALTILLWNALGGDKRWTLPQDTVYPENVRDELNCGIWQCIVTNDRQFESGGLAAFDAILLNAAQPFNMVGLADSEHQFRVFVDKHMLNAAPYNPRHSIDFYNLTMTYKLNARTVAQNYELFIADGHVPTSRYNYSSAAMLPAPLAEGKPLALFIVNPPCHYKSLKQGRLLKAIKEHMAVDILCEPVDNPTFSKYKFFLTFEAALCEDFLSNNFYKAIQNGVVPVVLAGGNYTRYLPNGTSISAEGFPTVLDLVEYLRALNQDSVAYAKYLRAAYNFMLRPESSIFCRLCSFLHHGDPVQGSYNVPSSWWQSSYCQVDSQLPFDD